VPGRLKPGFFTYYARAWHGLSSVDIRDYQSQSIASARIPPGKLAVVTEPTGSGKSAVIRARLLAFNARGTDYIRRVTLELHS
jgi:excinuclease UvrABC ATPase subunit